MDVNNLILCKSRTSCTNIIAVPSVQSDRNSHVLLLQLTLEGASILDYSKIEVSPHQCLNGVPSLQKHMKLSFRVRSWIPVDQHCGWWQLIRVLGKSLWACYPQLLTRDVKRPNWHAEKDPLSSASHLPT